MRSINERADRISLIKRTLLGSIFHIITMGFEAKKIENKL